MPIRSCRIRGRFHGRRRFLSVLLLYAVAFASTASACPGFLIMHQVPLKQRSKIPRDTLHLFSFRPDLPERWQELPMQLDPLDEEGSLLFPEEKDWMKKPVVPFDRISFFVVCPPVLGTRVSSALRAAIWFSFSGLKASEETIFKR